MAKETRVKFENEANTTSTKSSKRGRGTERQISCEETENCVNEINESFPALHNMNKAHRIMRQVSNSFSSRTIKVALIISVIFNLVICIPFGIFIGFWMSNNNNNNNHHSMNNNLNSKNHNFHTIHNSALPSHLQNINNINNNNNYNNNNNNNNNMNNNNLPSSSSSKTSSSSSTLLDTLSSSSSLSPQVNNNNNNKNVNDNNINSNIVMSAAIMESCVPCSSLNKNVQVKIRSKNNFCCTDVKTPDVGGATYLVLSDEYIKRKLDVISAKLSGCGDGKVHSGDSRLANPDQAMMTSAAHLMLNVKQTKENQLRNVERPLAWITHDPKKRSFVRNDLTYTKGHIVVQSTGVYHVYSHMTLSSVGNTDFKKTQVVHSITKYYKDNHRRSKTETLLITQISLDEDDLKTTNLEGSFELKDGDELYVYVSYPSLLNDDLTANVFGLFRL